MSDEPFDMCGVEPPQPNTALMSPFNTYRTSNLKTAIDAVIVFFMVLLGFEKVP